MVEAYSQSKLSEMSRQLVTLTDKITALEAQNTVVQNGAMSGNSWGTVASLAPRSSGQNVVRPTEQQREITNSVMAEQQDRERRKRSVLIFGLQASNAATSDAQREEDSEAIRALLRVVGLNADSRIERE